MNSQQRSVHLAQLLCSELAERQDLTREKLGSFHHILDSLPFEFYDISLSFGAGAAAISNDCKLIFTSSATKLLSALKVPCQISQ